MIEMDGGQPSGNPCGTTHYAGCACHEYIWQQRLDAVLETLRVLRNEVVGTLQAHELAIRYDHGNSNWKCLEMALDRADKALGLPGEWRKRFMP